MAENRIGVIVEVGDWIVDRMDDNRLRKISYFMGDEGDESVYMEDGGVMGINEITRDDVYLPGEIDGYN